MAIFQMWLDDYNKEKREKDTKDCAIENDKKEQEGAGKNKKRRAKSTSSSDDGDHDEEVGHSSKKRKPMLKSRSRAALEREYTELFDVTLQGLATSDPWPIRLNHCLMRVALDSYWQCCWYDRLDRKQGALQSMTVPQIENVLVVGEKMGTG